MKNVIVSREKMREIAFLLFLIAEGCFMLWMCIPIAIFLSWVSISQSGPIAFFSFLWRYEGIPYKLNTIEEKDND